MSTKSSPKSELRVLSTLERDGSRRWLTPKLSKGKLLERRRWFSYLLMVIFTVVPFIKIAGKPLVLLDIPARRFIIFGYTFLPTDTILLAILLVGWLMSIVLFTALFGRVWCGWACPQTVYMEFLFRPIERFFDGTAGRGGAKKEIPVWRTAAKYAAYLLCCFYVANTFLAYFVGVDQLKVWITQSPLEHPTPFLVMMFVTAAMMIDFCYFREQMCTIACPYGRFQSVLLDRNSLIVAYDQHRGEPRGKKREKSRLPIDDLGDCVDCRNCVTTCPTGIDIREGLQMECINCAQCIDACNLVMHKIGRAPNLIRYSSQARDQGESGRLIRPRTIIYPLLLAGIGGAFIAMLALSKPFDSVILREAGNPYTMTEDGSVRNLIKLKITNRTDRLMTFQASIDNPEDAQIEVRESDFQLEPQEVREFHASVVAPTGRFQKGQAETFIEISNQDGVRRLLKFKLLGPF